MSGVRGKKAKRRKKNPVGFFFFTVNIWKSATKHKQSQQESLKLGLTGLKRKLNSQMWPFPPQMWPFPPSQLWRRWFSSSQTAGSGSICGAVLVQEWRRSAAPPPPPVTTKTQFSCRALLLSGLFILFASQSLALASQAVQHGRPLKPIRNSIWLLRRNNPDLRGNAELLLHAY